MNSLTKRADFLRAARGIRRVVGALTLEICPTPPPEAAETGVRVGFTASKKVGNAVVRNRCKRRLRAAATAQLPLYGLAGHDYVLVARAATLTRPFSALLDDLAEAMRKAHQKLKMEAGLEQS